MQVHIAPFHPSKGSTSVQIDVIRITSTQFKRHMLAHVVPLSGSVSSAQERRVWNIRHFSPVQWFCQIAIVSPRPGPRRPCFFVESFSHATLFGACYIQEGGIQSPPEFQSNEDTAQPQHVHNESFATECAVEE